MSLVNDMLRELRVRHGPEGLAIAGLEPVGPCDEPRSRARLTLRFMALAFVLPLYLVSIGLEEQDVTQRTEVGVTETDMAARHAAPEQQLLPSSEERTAAKEKVAQPTTPGGEVVESSVEQVATVRKIAEAPPPRFAVSTKAAEPVSRSAMKKRPAQAVAKSSTGQQQVRQTVARDPPDGAAWLRLYETLLDRGEAEAAEATILEGLGSAKDPSPLAIRYAKVLIGRGELNRARTVLQDHRPAAAFDADYEALLAWLLQSTAHHREAADAYRTLLASNTQLGDWWVGLAISLENVGDRKGALQAYQQARDSVQIKSALAKYASQRIAALNADG